METWLRAILLFYWAAGSLVMAQQGTLAGITVKPENILFVGNKSISSQDLIAIFRSTGTVTAQLSPESMNIYDSNRINHSLNLILAFYHSRGFIKAAISPPEFDFAAPGPEGKVQMRLNIIENHPYRLGQVKINGAEVLSQALLISLLNLQPKATINLSKITTGTLAIQEAYLALGYLDFDVKTRVDTQDDKKIADVVLDISEGKQYHLGRVEMVGGSPIKDSLIRQFLPFQSGDIFGKRAFETCLQFLNELGITPVLTASDVTFRYNRTEASVDVSINLEGKTQR
jgi:outer membrane protein assembly factor BamA